MPVVLAGAGPDIASLRARASSASVPVTIVERPGDALLFALLEAASALVFLAVEDFGIIPVEAMATGTPVVTLDVGGASETVLDGTTGAHVPATHGPREMVAAIERAMSTNPDASRERAREFDRGLFEDQIRRWISEGIN
jgi:glycosyltransferase involved in cell wall biosynthesis